MYGAEKRCAALSSTVVHILLNRSPRLLLVSPVTPHSGVYSRPRESHCAASDISSINLTFLTPDPPFEIETDEGSLRSISAYFFLQRVVYLCILFDIKNDLATTEQEAYYGYGPMRRNECRKYRYLMTGRHQTWPTFQLSFLARDGMATLIPELCTCRLCLNKSSDLLRHYASYWVSSATSRHPAFRRIIASPHVLGRSHISRNTVLWQLTCCSFVIAIYSSQFATSSFCYR